MRSIFFERSKSSDVPVTQPRPRPTRSIRAEAGEAKAVNIKEK
ncbi:MAG: hypothetical protein ABI707_13000 [Ferruginibacter sp.]